MSKSRAKDKMTDREYEAREKAKMEKIASKKRMRDRRQFLLEDGIRTGQPRISTKILLASYGLEKYYPFFRDAGFDLFEMFVIKTDKQCEEVLDSIEHHHSVSFPPHHRVLMWKMLRYRHFHAPITQKRYIWKSQIPQLLLPKKDHRMQDTHTEFSILDPERQRQVVRKYEFDEREGRRLVQRDIYERHVDVVYILKDLQRCIREWQNRDPKKMIREDPREEVLLMRIREVENQVAASIKMEKISTAKKQKILFFLGIMRVGLLFIGLMCVFIAYTSNSPSSVVAETRDGARTPISDRDSSTVLPSRFFFFFTSSKQFLSGISLLMGSFVCVGLQRSRVDKLGRLRMSKAYAVCKKLHNHMVNFRLSSEDKRAEKLDEELVELKNYYGLEDADFDYSVYKKTKLNFAQWFARATAIPFAKNDLYEEIKHSESVLARQNREPLPGGDRGLRMEDKLRAASNPHKSGREIKTAPYSNLSQIVGANYNAEEELELIEQIEKHDERRERRRQILREEGYHDSDIESSDLHSSNQSSQDMLDMQKRHETTLSIDASVDSSFRTSRASDSNQLGSARDSGIVLPHQVPRSRSSESYDDV